MLTRKLAVPTLVALGSTRIVALPAVGKVSWPIQRLLSSLPRLKLERRAPLGDLISVPLEPAVILLEARKEICWPASTGIVKRATWPGVVKVTELSAPASVGVMELHNSAFPYAVSFTLPVAASRPSSLIL